VPYSKKLDRRNPDGSFKPLGSGPGSVATGVFMSTAAFSAIAEKVANDGPTEELLRALVEEAGKGKRVG